MVANRRMGRQDAATRQVLMDAIEAVMREEGYAAATSRRVAERAGVTQQTVYYYFQTLDDLFVAAYRRRTARTLEAVEQALASERPLHGIWRTSSDPTDAAVTMEYLALANHNERVRLETVEFCESLRRIEVDKLGDSIRETSPDSQAVAPLGIIMALTYVAHLMGFEATVGLRGGHRETRMLVEWCLRQLEPVGARPKTPAS